MQTLRLDDGESIFFARELEHIKARSFDIKKVDLKARSLIPMDSSAGPGDESITYRQFDSVGLAKVIANYANDLPRADVLGTEFTSPIKSMGSSFGYSIQEIRAAAAGGRPLEQRKANSARRVMSELENKIAYFGDVACGLGGFFTNANIPDVALPADGATTGTDFADKILTPDLIIRDLNSMANTVTEQSLGVEVPDTLLLPLAQFNLIAATPRSSTSDTTILSYFMENNRLIQNADWVNELAAANSQGNLAADTGIVYRRSPDVLTLEIPSDYEQFAPQQQGLEFEVAVHQRIGGVLIYYPLAMTKCDDI